MDPINEQALRAARDELFMNDFIAQNRSFILGCAGNHLGHYVSESDDEYSIAMHAFFTAITKYDTSQGDFLPFAGLVIKRRLTDYYRSQRKYMDEHTVAPEVFSGAYDEESEDASLHYEVSQKMAERPSQGAYDEIQAVQEIFSQYGFSFMELTECSPKAGKTKTQCAKAVRTLIDNPVLLENMKMSRRLPIKALEGRSGVSAKVLERHRKYIIAAAEILTGDYPTLGEYMKYIKKGETD